MPRTCGISITTDYADAEAAVRQATEILACEVSWGGEATTSVEAVETLSGGPPAYLAGYEMRPGEGELTDA